MPHYYDVSYYDSFADDDTDCVTEAVQFKHGDVVLVYLNRETQTVVHKGTYLYPIEGHEVTMHRIDTWTGAGCVDVATEHVCVVSPLCAT